MTGAPAPQTGLGSAEAPEPHSGLRPSGAIPRAGSLLDRLRAKEHKGQFAMGGGTICADGTGSTWGGEKIMEPRNPDGSQAADLIELLGNALKSIRGVGALTRRDIDEALRFLAKARGEQ